MDNTTGKREGTGTHIWLRHAVQFAIGDRTHTIEMEMPVPIGASTEEWERLLREAEARLQQLASRVEGRTGQQNLQRQVPAQSTASSSPAPVKPSVAPSVNKATTPPAAPAMSTLVPTPAPPTREVTQAPPPERREGPPPSSPTPTRTSIGASMPAIPGDHGDSVKLPQFIQYIKEAMGLTPKQAMELLNVKTLSGLNYRDTIEQLQQLVSRDAETMPLPSQATIEGGSSQPEGKRESASNPGEESEEDEAAVSPSPAPLMPPPVASHSKHTEVKELHHAVVREAEPAYGFDEEDDLDIDNVEEAEEPLALSVHERTIAENVLSRLREARGSNVASDSRLKALKNVVGDQVSNEQLLQLIQGVWSVNGLKKLKNDQVEALISWAKEDEFMNEAEVVLAVLQEDEYARSDR